MFKYELITINYVTIRDVYTLSSYKVDAAPPSHTLMINSQFKKIKSW